MGKPKGNKGKSQSQLMGKIKPRGNSFRNKATEGLNQGEDPVFFAETCWPSAKSPFYRFKSHALFLPGHRAGPLRKGERARLVSPARRGPAMRRLAARRPQSSRGSTACPVARSAAPRCPVARSAAPCMSAGMMGLQAVVPGSGDAGKGIWCGLEMSEWLLRGNSNLERECE